MFADSFDVPVKQFCQLLSCQPHGFLLRGKLNFQVNPATLE